VPDQFTAREAVRKWARRKKTLEERPALADVLRVLCDEHERMETTLTRISENHEMVKMFGPDEFATRTLEKVGMRRFPA
jgi:hypothetical protein